MDPLPLTPHPPQLVPSARSSRRDRWAPVTGAVAMPSLPRRLSVNGSAPGRGALLLTRELPIVGAQPGGRGSVPAGALPYRARPGAAGGSFATGRSGRLDATGRTRRPCRLPWLPAPGVEVTVKVDACCAKPRASGLPWRDGGRPRRPGPSWRRTRPGARSRDRRLRQYRQVPRARAAAVGWRPSTQRSVSSRRSPSDRARSLRSSGALVSRIGGVGARGVVGEHFLDRAGAMRIRAPRGERTSGLDVLDPPADLYAPAVRRQEGRSSADDSHCRGHRAKSGSGRSGQVSAVGSLQASMAGHRPSDAWSRLPPTRSDVPPLRCRLNVIVRPGWSADASPCVGHNVVYHDAYFW